MGSLRFAALAVLLLAPALLPPHPAAAARVLEGEKPRSIEGATAPTAGKGGSDKSSISKESENPVTDKQHQKTQPPKKTQTQTPPPPETTQTPPPPETTQTPPPPEKTQTPKDSPPPPSGVSEDKKPGGDGAQVSAQPVPSTGGRKESPPPGDQESKNPDEQEVAAKCKDPVDTCSIDGKLSACLQISKTASILIVKNTGKKTITVSVKATSDISFDQTLLPLNKGESKRVSISYSNPNGGEITLNVGTEPCVLQIGQQPVYDWQQQFQQLAVYATSMKPIYGVYFFVFTVVLVGAVYACCKFAGKKRDEGVQYQQLEMGSQAPDSSGANNTTSTVDGWDEGWDDDDWDDEEAPSRSSEKGSSGSGSANVLSLPARSSEKGSAGSGSSNGLSLRPQTSSKDGWDDEEAPARSSEKGSAGSGSANGLSLRPQTNSTDGWDVDWDD